MTDRSKLVKQARSRAGLTAREVAYMIQADASRVSKLETGAVSVTEDTIRRYLDAKLITRAEATAVLLGEAA